MVYNPATDFLAIWRNVLGQASKAEMPGLDFMVSALARAGFITLSVSATAPVVSQSTTAWLQAAVPGYTGEGVMRLWDPVTAAYVAATPALFFKMLETAAGQNGVSWWTAAGGPPLNTVGNDGDFSVRTDEPGGIYGPKVLGAWPVDPLPGTTDIIGSDQLDLTFGATPGLIIYRGPTEWEALPIGADNRILASDGTAPLWHTFTALFDELFGDAQGSLLYRGAGLWAAIGPGTAGQVMQTNGPAANPTWAPRTAEFLTGDTIVFRQTTAPLGWTKQTLLNDVGLRVTSGAVGNTPGTAFSTVFAQTTVGSTTLTSAQMPSHHHDAVGGGTLQVTTAPGIFVSTPSGQSTTDTGGGGSHNHSVQLALAYCDVIIASKN